MNNLEAFRSLAKSSFLGQAYKESYKYSTALIEADPLDTEAWLIKGLSSAALMPNDESITVEEVLFNIDRGLIGASEPTAIEASESIKKVYQSLKKSLDKALIEKITDHHKVPMPVGGSVLLHRVAQKGYARLAAKDLAPKRLGAIKLLEKAYELNKNDSNLQLLAHEIDSFISHSKEHSDYLNDELDINNYLWDLRSYLSTESKKYGSQVPAYSSSGSGCFIATAATGSYDHPKVLILRLFRDNFLQKYTWGRVLTKTYYKLSPPLAKCIEKDDRLKNIALVGIVNPATCIASYILTKIRR